MEVGRIRFSLEINENFWKNILYIYEAYFSVVLLIAKGTN
jgi:hypothetical protein